MTEQAFKAEKDHSDELKLCEEEISLEKVIGEIVAQIHRPARMKGLKIQTKIATGLPSLALADPVRLRQCLMIMLSNSVRMTDRGGILLSVAVVDQSEERFALELTVSDTGKGAALSGAHSMVRKFVAAMHGVSEAITDEFSGSKFRCAMWFEVPAARLHLSELYRNARASS